MRFRIPCDTFPADDIRYSAFFQYDNVYFTIHRAGNFSNKAKQIGGFESTFNGSQDIACIFPTEYERLPTHVPRRLPGIPAQALGRADRLDTGLVYRIDPAMHHCVSKYRYPEFPLDWEIRLSVAVRNAPRDRRLSNTKWILPLFHHFVEHESMPERIIRPVRAFPLLSYPPWPLKAIFQPGACFPGDS